MKTSDFDYVLSPHLIAQTPIEPRDASRLMVLSREKGTIEHRVFRDIVDYLQQGDVLVCNDSRVIPARLYGRKVPTGGKVELLLIAKRGENTWEALVKGRKVRAGTEIRLTRSDGVAPRLNWTGVQLQPNGKENPYAECRVPGSQEWASVLGRVLAKTESGGWLIDFSPPIEPILDDLGVVPLPPYIHEPLADPERYQTIYARVKGSVAAPTAGLHFTPQLEEELRKRGVDFAFITLHIGLDTFRPVRSEELEEHPMHREYCQLSLSVAAQVNRAKAEGRRIVAVGTTSVRALETAAVYSQRENPSSRPLTLVPFKGWTGLFIYPGYRFRIVDALITNFHLPRSTLLMLVAAFAGKDLIDEAYRQAIRQRYRFYSFGDAMAVF